MTTVGPGDDARQATEVVDRRSVERMATGDRSALGDLYDRHARAVYGLACRVLDDRTEAEDVVQEVFAQAWRQCALYDAGRGTVAAWLLIMCRTRAIDRRRARRSRPQPASGTGQLPDPPDPRRDPEATAVDAEAARRLREALHDLAEPQRLAIELAYFQGLSQTEIAERLREPLGTIKTRMRTGLLRLRQALRQE